MGGRAAGFRPAVGGGVGRLSPGSDWLTDFPDFGRTALRSPMLVLHSAHYPTRRIAVLLLCRYPYWIADRIN
jgi:hypothetical protein